MKKSGRNDSIAFINGEIYSLSSPNNTALYAKNGIIKAFGSDKEILELCDSKTTVLDMKKKLLMPGFTDTYSSLMEVGRKSLKENKKQLNDNEKACYRAGVEEYLKVGVTSLQTDDSAFLKSNSEVLDFYREVADEKQTSPRVTPQLSISNSEEFQELLNSKNLKEYIETFERTPPVRIAIDGTLGESSAALNEEYIARPGYYGLFRISQKELDKIVEISQSKNIQLIFLATGDAAIERCLKSIERSKRSLLKHRIRYCRVGSKSIYQKMKEVNIMADISPNLLSEDMKKLLPILGAERSRMCDSWKSMISAGILIGSGSEANHEIDPLLAIRILLFRRDKDNEPQYGWIPSQRLNREEAFFVYTAGGAEACMEESFRGDLTIGKRADIIAFTDNPLDASYEEFSNIKIGLTVVDGRIAYLR